MFDLHPEGEVITLLADNSEEYGEGLKEYKVRYRFGSNLVRFGDPGFPLSVMHVVVADPDA